MLKENGCRRSAVQKDLAFALNFAAMTYQETIDYLYARLPMFTKIGVAAYKEDLDNTLALCAWLDDPQNKFRSIHVAGTNGKGSCSHMLAAILQQAGYKTGLYTSPHIKDFGERIRISGQMIDPQFVIGFTQRTKAISDEVQPSFFELTVAMAFEYFAQEEVDIAVIETGLGGRLDSTNVIHPVLSVITNIGYDHVNILGDTLEKIAAEKAGIIKASTPVVIGETLPETGNVFVAKAAKMHADIHFAEAMFTVDQAGPGDHFLSCRVLNNRDGSVQRYKLDLSGIYQLKNLRTVLAATEILKQAGFSISDEAITLALQQVKTRTGLRGRWDVLSQNPLLVQDVAHNEDGIKQVLAQLENNYAASKKHFVLGFVKDKDVRKVLSLFPKDAAYYFTNAHIERALPVQELQLMAAEIQLTGDAFDDVNCAIAAAKASTGTNDVIVACGSFFIIAEITG